MTTRPPSQAPTIVTSKTLSPTLTRTIITTPTAMPTTRSPFAGCKDLDVVENFDLDAYISAKWYIQQQQVVDYLPAERFYCVTAEYSRRDNPGLFRYDINVKNKAYEADRTTMSEGNLCAFIAGNAKLAVAPCFVPRFAAGPYWIVAYNEEEGYALVSGGQPSIKTENGCKNGDGTNNSGLWIFTRDQQRNETLVAKVRDIAAEKGFDLSVLLDVDQTNCPVEE
eukprot:CAMPEP_0170168362 /NCGR_PEP_ID=MMETSP0040_2-20121228/1431_1 /TAXON_ID=641309 /ORGANISM="Lotharella oceanica, Strain CCMP622" /LENGTH=223 /DNA_ID=CAMNT_0010406595 /DNA_START=151 /DNA_END=822 /DNA_ORIENTATION=-